MPGKCCGESMMIYLLLATKERKKEREIEREKERVRAKKITKSKPERKA